jgi:osmoprotectant transport system ATP-binding protein
LLGVSKRFEAVNALDPVDLEFPAGRTTVLIGPSGCGKSTLLRLIIGLVEPSSGAVYFEEQPVVDWIAVRWRMGYVIQEGGLFPHLASGENVLLMARHLKRPGAWMEERLEELCRLTHFPREALRRYPGELSGGQRQRVGLMRALFLQPKVLLLDEPLAALDPMVRSALQSDLKRIFTELKLTVILVTHDLAEAGFLGDDLILMRAGKVVQRGRLDDLRERPADSFVTQFLDAQRALVRL